MGGWNASAVALASALAGILVAPGCGGEPETATVTETVTETVVEAQTVTVTEMDGEGPGGADLAQQCENPDDAFSVRFPAGWHTNPGEVTSPCSYFHPEEFELPENAEVTGIAISIGREPVAFRQVTGEDPSRRVLEREETRIDGRRAVRRVTESTGEALFPEGVRGLEYLVDLDGETLIASSYDVGDLRFRRNRDVLAAMVQTLQIG